MERKLTWKAKEAGVQKSTRWYWSVGIVAGGGSVASIIGGNVLFALLLLVGGFAIMVAGSRPTLERMFRLDNAGVHMDATIIAWEKIRQFAIEEKNGHSLVLATDTLMGVVTISLAGTDFREVRTELKNRNVEEADSLESFARSITKALGL